METKESGKIRIKKRKKEGRKKVIYATARAEPMMEMAMQAMDI
jgi:hypothetical protein